MSAPLRLVLVATVGLFHAIETRGATLGYSTYFGAGLYEGAYAVAVDASGNAYVAGSTASTNAFPLLNALQPVFGGGNADAFLAKFDPDGHLIFSTYFGGTGYDAINDLALDRDGNVVLVGETRSVDLPSTDDAFQYDYAGGSAFGSGDGFIARFSPDGAQLLYCSYFGGSGDETITGLAIETAGNVCIGGYTDSLNLPLRNALQPNFGGGDNDDFVAKFDSTHTNLVFSTYLGGEDMDGDTVRIAVDPAGFIYVSGWTISTNFPVTPAAFQTNHVVVAEIGQNSDAFVSKLTPDGSALVYSTYIGDAFDDAAYDIAVDKEGRACITGEIRAVFEGINFGFQSTPGFPGGDAYIAKFTADGSDLDWFSYLGGSGSESGFAILLDASGNIFVTGITDSADFPISDAPQPQYGGGQDAFIAKISADGKQLLYSTYLGGGDQEWGYAAAVDVNGNVIAVGQTRSIDFPTQAAIQTTNASSPTTFNPADAYLVKLSPAVAPPHLHIARSGNYVLISWPTNFTGFILESTPLLSLTAAWTRVASAPLVLGDQFAVVQRSDAGNRFFRLRRPGTEP